MKKTKKLVVEITSDHDAKKQLEQLLNEEVRCECIKSYKVDDIDFVIEHLEADLKEAEEILSINDTSFDEILKRDNDVEFDAGTINGLQITLKLLKGNKKN